jgi:fructose-bisphosphate aldolase class I
VYYGDVALQANEMEAHPVSAAGKFTEELIATARAIAAAGKGILAADESTGTIGARFKPINVDNTEENRRRYRELLFTSEGLEKYISGVILYEETLFQKTSDGTLFAELLKKKGIIPGIKVDQGLKPLPGTDNETACTGLTGLPERCDKYYAAGARFAKWRAAYRIEVKSGKPSHLLIQEQAWGLARYAAICQAHGLCPIVEPEVMIDGDHDIETAARISERVYSAVVRALHDNGVLLEGALLKPNMVTNGQESGKQSSPQEVAFYTIRTLRRTIPAAMPGIMFLSGGQTEEEASLHLNAMNIAGNAPFPSPNPWTLSFSYGRALQASCLDAWVGKDENKKKAQDAFLVRAKANSEAQLGKYGGGNAGGKSLYQKGYTY